MSRSARVVTGQRTAAAGKPFCAVEPMTAPTDALVSGDHPALAPGATFAAGFTATVRELGVGR